MIRKSKKMVNIKFKVMMASEWEVGEGPGEGPGEIPEYICLSLELVVSCMGICYVILHTFPIL